MTEDRHDRISQRAHELWEKEGTPEGQDAEHWKRARESIEAEEKAASPSESVEKPATRKAADARKNA